MSGKTVKKTAVILGGGEGRRAGGEPKQFRLLLGRPVIWWAMKAFRDADPSTRIIVIIHPEYLRDWDEMQALLPEAERIPHEYYCGGRSRFMSVANALMAVNEPDGLIAVHDGARPCLSTEMVNRGWETAQRSEACVPVIPLSDSLRRVVADGESRAVPRAEYRAVQTPQVFSARLLKAAYSCGERPEYTDDASVVEAYGTPAAMYDGDADNIKITYPRDFVTAEYILGAHGYSK